MSVPSKSGARRASQPEKCLAAILRASTRLELTVNAGSGLERLYGTSTAPALSILWKPTVLPLKSPQHCNSGSMRAVPTLSRAYSIY